MSTPTRRHPSAATPLVTAAGAIGVLAVVASVALRTGAGQRLDQWSMSTVVAGRDAEVTVLSLLGRISIGAVLVVATACVALAITRGKIRLAAAALLVIGGANLTTQLLKVALDRSALDVVAPNSLPSGHTTVVASAVGGLLLTVPRSMRPAMVVVGALATTATGASTIVAGWHRPADIVAALAVCVAWTAVGAMVVGGSRRAASGVVAGSVVGAGAALVLMVGIGVRPAYGWSGFGGATLVLGAMALATAISVALMERVAPTAQP